MDYEGERKGGSFGKKWEIGEKIIEIAGGVIYNDIDMLISEANRFGF